MKISKLPPEIRARVKANQIAAGNSGYFEGELHCTPGQGNFWWGDSPEGDFFWTLVTDGKFEQALRSLPQVNYEIF